MATKRSKGKKSITLRDVISHIQGVKTELSTDMKQMEQRLTKRIDNVETGLTKRIDGVEKSLSTRINEVESNLSDRIDGLGKDIDVTMRDTIKIRQHVGIAVPDEE